jgi:hypothetical protein
MNLKIHQFAITIAVLISSMVILTLSPTAFAQNNQTGTVEDKLMQSSESNSMRATAPGDVVFVLICPQDFKSIDECQVFAGQPI